MKRNISILGLIIGLIVPMLGMMIMYLVKFGGQSFNAFVQTMTHNFDMAALVLSFSILANIIPFIYYTNRRLDLTARGILIATVLYAVLIVLLKFVW
ncbi:MAG: hypothetical protein KDC07_02410 [Chitinophagaceae bacterium]|nr:hypothetical protein [Chitinophagaceae bacterium]MCB9047492.1 hypothetical protein [Chitinophagales bacterium]